MYRLNKTKISLIKGDITEINTDAIVNAANNTLLGGGGVDGAIHKKGGRSILDQCIKIGGCPTGEARITTAGNLASKYVIHTVGPVYSNTSRDKELLYNSYYNSLKLSQEYEISSITFPAISTGAYGYPIDESIPIVSNALIDYIRKYDNLELINLIFTNDDIVEKYREYINGIKI